MIGLLAEATVSYDPVNVIQTGGLVAGLIFALIGLYRMWWVPGWMYRAKEAEAAKWEKACLDALGVAEKVTGVAKTSQRAAARKGGA